MTEVDAISSQPTSYPRMRVYLFIPVLMTLLASLLVLLMNPIYGVVEFEVVYTFLAVVLFLLTATSVGNLLLLMTSTVKIQMWRAYAISCIKAKNPPDRGTQLHTVSVECFENAVLGFIPLIVALIVGLSTLIIPRFWYPLFGIPDWLVTINLGVVGCALALDWMHSRNLAKYKDMSPEEVEQLYESIKPEIDHCDRFIPISGKAHSVLSYPQSLVLAILFAIAWIITLVSTHILG